MFRASLPILFLWLATVLPMTGFAEEPRERLAGVCFSSVRDNESPARQILALPSAVEADIATASRLARSVRTYTLSGSSYLIPEFCRKHQIDCIVGAWIGPLAWQNEAQLELLGHLVKQKNPSIKAVIIGNEVLHRGDCSESQLIEYIRRAQAVMELPVATADTWRAWVEHPKLAEEVDICGVQIYPYWEGLPIDGAAAYTVQRVKDIQKLYPSKRVVLTEFGWPTQGETLGQAEATPENAARYLREVIPLLEENGIEYYYFAIWDEKWKTGPEGNVGAHWGLFESDGTLKPEFEPLLPPDARAVMKRPPRTMRFALESDQRRNEAIAEAAFGPQAVGAEGQVIPQRGIGLEFSTENPVWNPYTGLRPIRPEASDVVRGDSPESAAIGRDREVTGESSVVAGNAPTDAASTAVPATDTDRQPSPAVRIRPKTMPLGPDEIYGVCLSLFRVEETPHLGITPLVSELHEDVSYAASVAHAVRTYSVTDSFSLVPEICDTVGVPCFPGAALGKYPWLNDLELEMLIRVGQADHPSVQAVIVGNEVLHRGDFSVEQYIQYIRRVKKNVRVPVATAELLHSWLEHPELAEEVDILGVQIYPYWGGVAIEEAAANTLESVQQLKSRFPGKRVILTEFGWPADGGAVGGAIASPENAVRYVREVIPLLNENRIEYMVFALTDEKWKQGDEGGPGPHWGILRSDGQVKPGFRELLPPAAAEGVQRRARRIHFEP
jgi:exo-beta-1,3-glucanase (GH17 family)